MKKLALLMTLATASMWAAEMTGYISDAQCGARNANSSAESQECAKSCVKNGSPAVFVTEKDQKVYKIADQSKVTAHVGEKVVVDGSVKGDTLTVASLKPAK